MTDWEIAKLDQAKVVEDYNGWLYDPFADEWFEDEEAFFSHYDSNDNEVPDYVFAANKQYFYIDIERVLENEAQNHVTENEYDIIEDLVDLDELRLFIDEWNKKQDGAYTWTEDYTRKVDMRAYHAAIMESRKT